MFKYFLWWFPMLLIATGNGTLRDLWYKQFIDELAAHQLSTVSLMLLSGIYTWIIIAKFPPESGRQAIWIGVMWMLLTLVFEFSFGFVRGRSWSFMLSEYNILEGRIWILIPIWLCLLPYLCWLASDSRS